MNKRASDQLLTLWVNQPVNEQANEWSTSDSLRQSVSQWTSERANHWIIEQAVKQHCHRRLTGYTCIPKRHVSAVEVSGNCQKTFREKHSYVSRQMCHVAVMDVSQEFLFSSVKDVSYRCLRSIRRKWSRGAIQLQKQIRISFLFLKKQERTRTPVLDVVTRVKSFKNVFLTPPSPSPLTEKNRRRRNKKRKKE